MRIAPLSFFPLLIFVHISCGKSEAHSVTPAHSVAPQPDQSALYIVSGRQAYQKGDYQEAEKEFKKALISASMQTKLLASFDIGKLYYIMSTKERNSSTRLTRLKQSLENLNKFLMGAEYREDLTKEYHEIKTLKNRVQGEIDKLMSQQKIASFSEKTKNSYQKMLEAPAHWEKAQRNFTIHSYGGSSSKTSPLGKSSKEPGEKNYEG